MLSQLSRAREEETIVQSYPQDNSKSNEELRNIINHLISRVERLETTKVEQSEQLLNITQVLEELKYSNSNIWKHYDDKLLSLEKRVLVDQSRNEENCKTEELNHLKIGFQRLKRLYGQLKSCCDTTLRAVNDESIQKQTDEMFAGYFGNSLSKEEVARIFQKMSERLEQADLPKSTEVKVSENDVDKQSSLDIDEIRKVVLGILKIYDADKTGRVDYALESAGGQVISIRCTQQYSINTRVFHIVGLIPYSSDINDPRTVIQGNDLQPGMCWAFQDFPGYLLIKLRSQIYVTGFTIEHASRLNLPNGEMKSAPKKFNVWGLKRENDLEPVMFGEYEFLDSHENLQYFPVQNTSIETPYEYVELRIHSNHGQLEYTCLYRFRIHGNLA